MTAGYVVQYEGARDRHQLIFTGEGSLCKAINYARERGTGAAVIDLATGEPIRWETVHNQEGSPNNGSS